MKIKQLEWKHTSQVAGDFKYSWWHNNLTRYSVEQIDDDWYSVYNDYTDTKSFATLEEAKAWCQKDFEDMVMKFIEV